MQKGELFFTVENMEVYKRLGTYVQLCDGFEEACSYAKDVSAGGNIYAVCSYRQYINDDGGKWFTRKVIIVYANGEPTDA